MPRLVIQPDGTAQMVYSYKWAPIARALGALTITRATDVEWNDDAQQWEAHHRASGKIIAAGPNRADVIRQEVTYLEEELKCPTR